MQKWRPWETANEVEWGLAVERESVIRPLAEEEKLTNVRLPEARDGKRGGAPASVLAPILDSTRQVLILQQEFLVDQSGNVGQKPRACGCVRPQRPS